MIRRSIVKSFVTVIIFSLITAGMTSCALFSSMTKKESLSYANDRPLFVGVYQGLNTERTATVFNGFDVLRDEYSGYFHFKAKNAATFGLTYSLCRCTIKVTTEREENGKTKIIVRASEPKLQNSRTKNFEDYSLNLVHIENEVTKAIFAVMNESDIEFEAKLDKTISNLDFIHSVCIGMNAIAFKQWIEKVRITEREVRFTMPLYELSESKEKGYKYTIVGVFTPEQEKKYGYHAEDMFVQFETNNDDYIKYRKGENITLKGKIKSIKQNPFGSGYTIEMTE
ncbi:hypothetical protein [Treponema pedis]|uniref:hypothetical protein n=1 Tax=Treponema pedis TaxID=409322 RepID=UPI0004066BD8|nr:hypothetical protein [Treponema pedis]